MQLISYENLKLVSGYDHVELYLVCEAIHKLTKTKTDYLGSTKRYGAFLLENVNSIMELTPDFTPPISCRNGEKLPPHQYIDY
jgi:hypothetical protein